jgi:regulatory protein
VADDGRARGRKPSPAERREQRSQVEDAAEVLDAAARFLEARQRSEAEVRRKLLRLGYRTELVDEVLTRLVELNYLDDEAFARAWVESRDRAKPRGEHALRAELGRLGVERGTVDTVLVERREGATVDAAGAPDEEPRTADEAAAERLLAKRLPSILREADPRRRRQKAYGLLARSGFSPDVCGSVSRRVLDAAGQFEAEEDEPVP